MKRCLILSILVGLTVNLGATTYYVRTDGNNANDGLSSGTGGAWQTIQYCTDRLTDDDIGWVKPGTYSEAIDLDINEGAAGHLIEIRGDKYGDIWAGGGVVAVDLGDTRVYAFNTDKAYWTIRGFRIQNANHQTYYAIDNRTGVDYITLEDCEFTDLKGGVVSEEDSIRFSNAEYCVIRNCSFHDNVVSNDIQWTGSNGQLTNNVVEGCVVYDCTSTHRANISLEFGGTNNICRNNVIYNCDGAVGCLEIRRGWQWFVYNNTIRGCYGASYALGTSDTQTSANKMFNNVVSQTAAMIYTYLVDADCISGGCDYNWYYGVASPSWYYNGTTYTSSVTWRAVFDANGGSADPLFDDGTVPGKGVYSKNAYQLRGLSPLIDKGVVIATVTDDIEGRSRPTGSNDIGCYQYGIGSSGKLLIKFNFSLVAYLLGTTPLYAQSVPIISAKNVSVTELKGIDLTKVVMTSLTYATTYWMMADTKSTITLNVPITLLDVIKAQPDYREIHKFDSKGNKLSTISESKTACLYIERFRGTNYEVKRTSSPYDYMVIPKEATLKIFNKRTGNVEPVTVEELNKEAGLGEGGFTVQGLMTLIAIVGGLFLLFSKLGLSPFLSILLSFLIVLLVVFVYAKIKKNQ